MNCHFFGNSVFRQLALLFDASRRAKNKGTRNQINNKIAAFVKDFKEDRKYVQKKLALGWRDASCKATDAELRLIDEYYVRGLAEICGCDVSRILKFFRDLSMQETIAPEYLQMAMFVLGIDPNIIRKQDHWKTGNDGGVMSGRRRIGKTLVS